MTSIKRSLNGVDKASKRQCLENEFERRMIALNRSFASWVEDSEEANLQSSWEDGIYDYISYAEQLTSQFELKGELYTNGSGDCGQLGHGVEEESERVVSRPRLVKITQGKEIRAIACGGMHNAIVIGDGNLWSWGCGDDGVLGREGDENFPAPVAALNKVSICQISAGDCHTAAISLSGDLFIWGAYKDRDGKNFFRVDELSSPLRKNRTTPFKVSELSGKFGGVIQVESGAHHTVALCGDGKVFSWGIGDSGQLGRQVCELKDNEEYQTDKIRDEHLKPQLMQYKDSGDVEHARAIACGGYHTFIIKAIRSCVYACGLNQYGQLGINPENGPVDRLQLVTELEGKHIRKLVGGEQFSVALSCAGKVYSFGRADQSQLGVPLEGDALKPGSFKYKPQEVNGELKNKIIKDVSCGSAHTVAMTVEGDVYSWGFGVMNQLGHKGEEDEPVPRKLQCKALLDRQVKGIACGGQHSALILNMYEK